MADLNIVFDVKRTEAFLRLVQVVDDIAELKALVPTAQKTEADKILDRIATNIGKIIDTRQQ